MTTFTIITRGTETAAELDAVMTATRAWWAQFEPDAPEFVLAATVADPRSERARRGEARARSVDDLREQHYDRFVGDERD